MFHQVQEWLGNALPPEMWGWKRGADGNLEPVTAHDPPAPETVLKSIFCRCKSGCTGNCGCRKAGITCSRVCSGCLGSCTNGIPIDLVDVEGEDDDDVVEDND